jgi:hypothetical protein
MDKCEIKTNKYFNSVIVWSLRWSIRVVWVPLSGEIGPLGRSEKKKKLYKYIQFEFDKKN